jgi:hypothetical protein
MSELDDYARSRESGRVRGLIVFGAFVFVMGLAVAFAISGPAGVAVAIVTVAIVVFFAIVFARVPQPTTLTSLSPRVRSGSWPATAAASVFPEMLERHPNLRGSSEVTGVLTFSPSGVTWEPTSQSARSFGLQTVHWDAAWTAEARRLRGFGGLVQLTLANPQAPHPVTLWMRQASTFQIP